MKTFSYTVRRPNGDIQHGSLAAESRAEALAKLKASVGAPLTVEEKALSMPVSPVAVRRALYAGAGLLGLAVLGLALVRLRPDKPAVSEAGPSVDAARPPAPVANVPPRTLRETVENRAPDPVPDPVPEAVAVVPETAPSLPPRPAVARPVAPRALPGPSDSPPARYSPGGRLIARTIAPVSTNLPPQDMELQTGVDRTVNLIANATPGLAPPPRLDLRTPGEDILKSLDTDIILLQEDDRSVERASNIAYAKQAIKQYIAEGGDMDSFLEAYHQGLQLAYEERQEANRQLMELLKTGNHAAAERFVKEQNAVLEEKGIAPLKIPEIYRKGR